MAAMDAVAVVLSLSRSEIGSYDEAFANDPVMVDQADRFAHVCFVDGDRYTVVDVWRSRDAFARFEAHLDEVHSGRGDPEHRLYSGRFGVYPVHNMVI